MLGDFFNKKPIYSFNNDIANPMTRKEPDDLTYLTIKIGFAGVTAILMISLVLLCIIVLT